MESGGDVYGRLWKQELSVRKLILDGNRNPEEVSRVLQLIIQGKRLVEARPTAEELLADWASFYKEVYGLQVDFSKLLIPGCRQGFDRLIVVAQGMAPQRLFDKCAELFPATNYSGCDLNAIKSVRSARDSAYAVWVRDRVEADEENQSLSAEQLDQREAVTETFEERMLHEQKFFKETSQHLDVQKWTLCAGSRFSGGGVPSVCWDGRLQVGWCDSRDASPLLRARSVVSLPAEVAKQPEQA